MRELVRKMPWAEAEVADLEPLLAREWLITNGLGGYASGTVAGVVTRRYHGLLVAALSAPAGRTMLLTHLSEQIRLPNGENVRMGEQTSGAPAIAFSAKCLAEFRLESGLPVWHYQIGEVALEKRVLLLHRQNTVFVVYRLLGGADQLRLKLLPSVQFRPHDSPVSTPLPKNFRMTSEDGRHELTADGDLPPLRMKMFGDAAAFTSEPRKFEQLLFHMEESRGYDYKGDLWSPGYFRVDLALGKNAALAASTESWDTILALTPDEVIEAESERRYRLMESVHELAQSKFGGELVMAADQFIIVPRGRMQDAARVQAAGDEARSLIAGYHWFTDWGRDTMISLEGLTLITGRPVEAGDILRTFAHFIRDGLIPNLFPEGEKEGKYNTADATLWFFHALARYVLYSDDRTTIKILLTRLHDIVNWHVKGTLFNIGVDPADGLLRQGAEGVQLTWMDAKVGDWVVTPRRGKAVEINALWYNALRLMEQWVREEQGAEAARYYEEQARQVEDSFNRRFWHAEAGYLYDVVDGPEGNDPACRPNQIFSVSLDYPVLKREYWEPVVEVVRQRLLTPVGLRTLDPNDRDYQARYFGDLRARDAAYHQGTVWAWLIGPFIDAWLRLHPDDQCGAREMLKGFEHHLSEACIGTISEVFDAEEPHMPRGCVAQAWSVAEVLRAYVKTKKEPSRPEQA